MIGNLVHSSPNIKKEVILAGALQPVIGLLRYVLYSNFGKLPHYIIYPQFLITLYSSCLMIISCTKVFLSFDTYFVSCKRSCCSESQREAALLLGQFAATDSDCKVSITLLHELNLFSLY